MPIKDIDMNFNDSALNIVKEIFVLCEKYQLKIRTAESCTGGAVASYLTSISGSSKFFDRAVIVYSNNAKEELLNIPTKILRNYGAVSYEVAKLMVESLLKNTTNTAGIAITGILGPNKNDSLKPVGLVYVGVNIGNKINIVKKYKFSGNRNKIREETVLAALNLILTQLKIKKLFSALP